MGNKTSRQRKLESVGEGGRGEGRAGTCTDAPSHSVREVALKKRGHPESCMIADQSRKKRAKGSSTSSRALPLRRTPRRRIKRNPYSDDNPGTVTFEEQFGGGKEKQGAKQWVRNTATGEWMIQVCSSTGS
mmetsp:Transcript_18990/g.41367  ORF Transcript_18990/g.41367 Transcript_18990/m.41367 type:complete len:131 (-) Transcript_18990:39-431(-)